MADEQVKLFNPNSSDHVVSKGGKKFITYTGLQARLVDMGKGIIGSTVEVIQNGDDHESGRWVVKCSMTIKAFKSGEVATLEAIGDASKDNVGGMVAPHMPRMAETRAHVRILRVATRSPYTAAEEVG